MAFFDSTLFYLIIMVVAFVFLGIICSPKSAGPASTKIVAMTVAPADAPSSSTVKIAALHGGDISIERRIDLRQGDTVNLVITKFDSHVKIVEKKGVMGAGEESPHVAMALVSCIGQRWYSYRFESEVTGQWCTFEFTNVVGNSKQAEMRL
ncbi:MAG: hypothetical protein Q4B68_08050 [Bacteroidales bacterium]|nr:hypothetical protein [Bacteroidales bacterium]